jgi:hypothetical protein
LQGYQRDSVGHAVRDYEYDDASYAFRLVTVLKKLGLASDADLAKAERFLMERVNTFNTPGSQFTG